MKCRSINGKINFLIVSANVKLVATWVAVTCEVFTLFDLSNTGIARVRIPSVRE